MRIDHEIHSRTYRIIFNVWILDELCAYLSSGQVVLSDTVTNVVCTLLGAEQLAEDLWNEHLVCGLHHSWTITLLYLNTYKSCGRLAQPKENCWHIPKLSPLKQDESLDSQQMSSQTQTYSSILR